MTKIKLTQAAWQVDEGARLGPPGGFGEVFQGADSSGHPVAIKRLKLTAGAAAHRELSIGRVLASKSLKHVVPILDYGQDADSDRYYLVMPVADHSLQDILNQKGQFSWDETKPAIENIIAGLEEVGDLVHRDLKPGNILWHEGVWKVADFGIAKFVEDSTSLETLRQSLTPTYGAPEQWQGLSPTRATDVYALGCIIHALVNGAPPFGGDVESVRRAHLHETPPPLINVDPRLASLVSSMLRKSPDSRPSLVRVLKTINETRGVQRQAYTALAQAGLRVSEEEAARDAKAREAEATRQARIALVREAGTELSALLGKLFDEIESISNAARRSGRAIVLGGAHLSYNEVQSVERREDVFSSGWDVAAYSLLSLRCELKNRSYHEGSTYTFSASLIFAKIPGDPDFRWREVSFWGMRSDSTATPFALSPHDREFSVALSNVVGMTSVAHGPLTIDAEDEEDFLERWLKLFARAAEGNLRNPNRMPPPPSFFE